MLLSTNFTALLASILLVISLSTLSDARPAMKQRESGMIHMPLVRSHNLARTDIHPLLLYQQHANRGNRRLALMTGRAGPSDAELRENIERRMFLLPNGVPNSKTTRSEAESEADEEKRYVANGQVRGALANLRQSAASKREFTSTEFIEQLKAKLAGLKGKKKAAAAAAGGAAVGAGAGAAAGSATGAATGTAANATAAGTGAAGATSAGFSQIDLDAANNGGLTASDVKDANDTTGLDIEANDVGYIATVQIGTPPKDFRVLMDSGSSDFWVGATACKDATSGAACSKLHTSLGTATSSSFVDTKAPFQVTYGSGAVAGTIITDDVTLAGLPLKAHTFGASSVESIQFSADNVDFDGLMGLAQSTLSNQKVLTPPESLAKAGAITDAIVSYKISRLSDQKNDGQVTFGGLDTSKFDPATLVSIPNVSKVGFWEGALDAASVDGKDLGLTGRTAILDTGTTLIIAPPADAAAVHAAIPGSAGPDASGSFTIPCTSTASVALTFGGTSFAIAPQDMTFVPVNAKQLTGDCVSGISAGQVGGAQEWLVGDVFLKNAYFSTDVTKNTVSLAKLI